MVPEMGPVGGKFLPSATTARDILPTRPGETRPRTSHRDIAGNNSRKLQQLGTQVPACSLGRQ